MEVINKELLFEKKREIYEFISQYGCEYVDNITGSLWTNIVFNSNFSDLQGKIYNPNYYMEKAETVEELSFYHMLNLMMSIEWQNIFDLSPMTMQIFSKFQILNEKYDPYLEIYKLLKMNNLLNGNCLEVGAGVYPRLAELVNSDLDKNDHKLTIYEPNIILDKLQNITVVKDNFTKQTNLTGIDTLYGLFPCDASVTLAAKAFEEDKNLVLAFCDCDHSTEEYKKMKNHYWCETVCEKFKEKYGDEVEIANWSAAFDLTLPIMIRRKKDIQKVYSK